ALTLVAAICVYFKLTVWFFDSDLKNLRARSEVGDRLGRVQKRFATNLESATVVSRGKTEEEAHANAAEVLRRVGDLRRGTRIAAASWPDGAARSGRPMLRVDGCIARVRGAEIALPAGAPLPGPLAEGTEVLTRPDGSRIVVYAFRKSKALIEDWSFDGPAVYWGGAELRLTDGRGTVMRWKHELGAEAAARAQVTFAVRFLGLADRVTLGLGEGIAVAAEAGPRPDEFTGKPWPPMKGDHVRFTLLAGASSGVELVAGRDTILSVDSVAFRVPSPVEQRKSAKFVASIDADRVTEDIAEGARASGLKPSAYRKFTRKLGNMVESAGDPKLLTLGELASGEFGALVKKYYAADPEAGGERAYSVATYLYPEIGELPREWYRRLAAALRPHGEISATRLLSLAIRDIVHEDFQLLTGLVFAAVVVALLLTFGCPVRLVVSLGMLALGILAIAHTWFWLVAVAAFVLSAGFYTWSLHTYSWSPKAQLLELLESAKWSVAALGPVFASFALMLATLLIISHRLNFINVLVFPVLVGIGIDYGIHIVHRFRESAPVREIVTETGRAFVLTTLTTMAGFGSLIWSRYKGLNSFGFVTILGMTFVLLSSLVALPAFLVLLERRRAARAAAVSEGEGAQSSKGGE
ncbi:MAG: MMPL family transporter, partial [Planctomycetota bacterium]